MRTPGRTVTRRAGGRERGGATLLVIALAAALLGLASPGAEAQANCGGRLVIALGDTLSAIAQACGTNVERLVDANPGIRPDRLQAGTVIAVPPPALRSPQGRYGQPLVPVAPPLVRAPVPATGPTVILPPVRQPVPQQHILRGFGNGPGQLPLPPGHAPDPATGLFNLQQN